MGIVHQVNLEHLGRVVQLREGGRLAIPDTLVGTDSHTTMINALGVLGFGVGGIEAEAVMLGEPLVLGHPNVVGVRFSGALAGRRDRDRPRADADRAAARPRRRRLVRRVLRRRPVGALAGRPRDALEHVPRVRRDLGPVPGRRRDPALPARDRPRRAADLVDRYTKEQGLFRTRRRRQTPAFDDLVELDLGSVEPSLAGPSRPQDRVALAAVAGSFRDAFGVREEGVSVSLDGTAPPSCATAPS